jgi:hypothetical protein
MLRFRTGSPQLPASPTQHPAGRSRGSLPRRSIPQSQVSPVSSSTRRPPRILSPRRAASDNRECPTRTPQPSTLRPPRTRTPCRATRPPPGLPAPVIPRRRFRPRIRHFRRRIRRFRLPSQDFRRTVPPSRTVRPIRTRQRIRFPDRLLTGGFRIREATLEAGTFEILARTSFFLRSVGCCVIASSSRFRTHEFLLFGPIAKKVLKIIIVRFLIALAQLDVYLHAEHFKTI